MLVPANTIMSSGLFRIPFIFALIFILYSLHSFTRTPSRIFDSDFRDARPPLRSKNVLEDAPLNVRVHHQKLDSLHLQIPKESASLGSKSKTSIAGVRRGLTTPASDTALSDLLLTTSTPKHGISQQGIVQPKYSRLDPTNKKIILFWTRFFRKDNIHLHDNLENCTINTCFLTKNRSYLNRSAAIIFHQRDMHLHWHDLPPHRQPHQVYVFFFLESADFSTGWGEGVDLKQPQWMNFFNLTFTYRTDSDVYCPAYTHLIYNPQLWSDRAKFRETVERKKNRALLFNSHCKTPGRREDYYNELGKHFPVDVVGKCGKRVCEPDFMVDIVSGCRNPPCRANSSDCEQRLTESYKFYLAFENSYCKDYMTEKVIRPLNYGSVPIVYGGGDPSAMFPNKSFIHTANYPSPKRLAQYLWTLANSTDLYLSHHEWRFGTDTKLKLFDNPDEISACKLCKVLHNATYIESLQKRNLNIFDWWIKGSNCSVPPLNVSSDP